MYHRIISLLLFCLITILGFSQEKVIINKKVDTLRANSFQLFIIEVPNRDSAEIIIETSQGIITSMDGGKPSIELFNISGLEKGEVLIKVFKLKNIEKIFLGQKMFPVIEKPSSKEEKIYNNLKPRPVVTFCGKSFGFILKDSLEAVKKLFLSPPYELKSATVYFGCNDAVVVNLSSADLLPLINYFKKCGDGTCIYFTLIKIKNKNKIYNAPEMSFNVKVKL